MRGAQRRRAPRCRLWTVSSKPHVPSCMRSARGHILRSGNTEGGGAMQLAIHEHATVEEASKDLLDFVLMPANWLPIEAQSADPSLRPVQNAHYQRRVGPLRICACVDVS